MEKVRATLEKIGLTKGERDVYIALLEFGLSSTGKITKCAGISSSKVYEVLQRLISKGLANYVIERGVHHYSATPANRLIDFLENKKQEISEGQEAIRKLIPTLEYKRNKQSTSEAVIYRGKQGPLIVLNECLEAGKSGIEIVGFGTDEDDWETHYPAQLGDFIKESEKHKVKSRIIFRTGFTPKNYTAGVRHLPPEYFSPVRTVIYGAKVAIVDFTKPFTTIIIEKEEVAKAYINHFNLLWKIAKK
ncbi:TrmB family transcriptional regulator [Candidatus Woesearchaeota archaeon]|nr:TrmB family transcriptional regulator [Candidatus Woesearchaeota archaeon]